MRPYETLILDVTYRCNSPCGYCRWGNVTTPGRADVDPDALFVPSTTLLRLGTRRVVLSGGEPLLHPRLDELLTYYRDVVPERVVLTNGLLLTDQMRNGLISAGATGFTFSIDALDPDSYRAARGWGGEQLARVLTNLHAAANDSIEVGINAVVSGATARWPTVAALLDLAAQRRLSFVKFAPVFDDGYLAANAPHLALTQENAMALSHIAQEIGTRRAVATNPPGFWRDLARLASGAKLPGVACALGEVAALAVRGELTRCFWVPESTLGRSNEVLAESRVRRSLTVLTRAKPNCNVEAHCFCLQPLDHVWSA